MARKSLGQTMLGGPPIGRSADLDRVVALERRARPEDGSPESDEIVATVTNWFRRPLSPSHDVLLDAMLAGDAASAARIRAQIVEDKVCLCHQYGKPCILMLRPVQAWALLELRTERGMFGSIGMGWGKSILDILAALALDGCELALALVPPSLLGQLVKDYQHLSQHFRVPSIRVHGAKPWSCQVPPEPGPDGRPRHAPLLHVLPYSRLSSADASTFIEALAPDLIVADEMQNIGDRNSARTRRVMRYMANAEAQGKDVRFAGMTGTITDSGLEDYWHLLILALREGAPLPLDELEMQEWCRAIDPSTWPAEAGALDELDSSGDHVQTKYYRRLVETAGVISTVAPSTDVRVEISECVPAAGVPREVSRLIDDVRTSWMRPDGLEFFEDKIAQWRCLHNLACGFYYRWVFTRGTDPEIDRYLLCRKAWNREVRDVLAENRPRMDSPLLCARAAQRFAEGVPETADAPTWDSWAWEGYAEVQDTVDYYSEAVRVDDFLARDAARWAVDQAAADDAAIVWYESTDLGAWISEIATELGGDCPVLDGGPDAGERMDAERGDRSIVASIKSHGTGRDGMQYKFSQSRFCQPFASPAGWEQAIARLARPGQDRDVRIGIYSHTPELKNSLKQARERALYVQRTTGALQRMLVGQPAPDDDPGESAGTDGAGGSTRNLAAAAIRRARRA